MKNDPHRDREARKYDAPIASREHILAQLKELGEPSGFKRLAKLLKLESSDERDALKKRLHAMVRDGQLLVDRRNVYAIPSREDLQQGRVIANAEGFGFVQLEDPELEDVYISRRQMRAVFHGDTVLLRIRGYDRKGRPEGEIVEVVERAHTRLVGRLYLESDVAMLEPLNNRILHEILIQKSALAGATPSQIVVVEITEPPTLHHKAEGKVVEILGDHLTPGMEVDIALRNHDIPSEFSADVMTASDLLPDDVPAEEIAHRMDLRDRAFVTIDGEDARDFDDAVYCESRRSGGWRLYVAIADVAHYVRPETALDDEAWQRGTSVYFPQYVVPMLPEKLSNGICSLKPEVDRLTLVAEISLSAEAKITGYCFYEATIHSQARLTYTQVAAHLDGGEQIQKQTVVSNLNQLHDLFQALNRRRQERGALDFDTTELSFQFDDDQRIDVIRPVIRNQAHRLIEELMLCANVCAARFIHQHGKPGLFRVHDVPDPEKILVLREYLAQLNLYLPGDEIPTPGDFQIVINQLRDKPNGHVLQMAMLRTLSQAVYQPENRGHFGLNYQEYAHFTSPIRRYPDLLTHRLIKSVIHSQQETRRVKRVPTPNGRVDTNWYPYGLEEMLTAGEHCSMTERRADDAVYEVLEWLKCEYISRHLGERLPGVITAVTGFGFFVELNDIYVEGLVHISTLRDDFYTFDPSTHSLNGERSRGSFGLGDTVEVQVVRVNSDERKVDFELQEHQQLNQPNRTRLKKSDAGSKPKGKSKGKQQARRKGKPQDKSPDKSKGQGKAQTKDKTQAKDKRGAGSRRKK